MRKLLLILTFLPFVFYSGRAQKSSISLGNNLTFYSDWDKRPFNLFNPEIIFEQGLKRNAIVISVDCFYGNRPRRQELKTGTITDRLIFTLKCNYAFTYHRTSFGGGPAGRYRKERDFYPRPPGYDIVGDPYEAHFDPGINGFLMQSFKIGNKSQLSLKLNYAVFNHGRNPLSLGMFYGLASGRDY